VSSHKHVKFVNSIINSKDKIFNLNYVRCISAGHSTYGIINIIMVPGHARGPNKKTERQHLVYSIAIV
jgi:hypothetical protein